jgi:hypothetical protein
MNISTLTRPLAAAAVLSFAGLVAAGPALAASSAHPTKAQVEHAETAARSYESDIVASAVRQAQGTAARTYESDIVANAVRQAQGTAGRTYESDIVANAVRQTQGTTTPRQAQPVPPSHDSDPALPTSTLLVVLGGTVVAGAVGFAAYRFQHHGGIGPTPA